MRSSLIILSLVCAAGHGRAQDRSEDALKAHAHQLSLPEGEVDPHHFANRIAVKELIIADQSANRALGEVLTGDDHWSAKASAIYVLWQSQRLTFVSMEEATRLFSTGGTDLQPFAAAIIRFGYLEQASPDHAAMKWWFQRQEAADPIIDRITELLDTSPEWAPDEARRRIDTLLPVLTNPEGAMPTAAFGSREADLISDMGVIAVDPLRRAIGHSTNESIRKRLISALGKTQCAEAADVLRALLRDPSERVRGSALLAMKWCLGADALPELRYAASSDPSQWVRECAEEDIADILGSPRVAAPGDRIEHPTPGEWLEAHRDWAIAETRRQNEPIARAYEDALQRAHSAPTTASLRPDTSPQSKNAPIDTQGNRFNAILWGVLVAVFVFGFAVFLTHRLRARTKTPS